MFYLQNQHSVSSALLVSHYYLLVWVFYINIFLNDTYSTYKFGLIRFCVHDIRIKIVLELNTTDFSYSYSQVVDLNWRPHCSWLGFKKILVTVVILAVNVMLAILLFS